MTEPVADATPAPRRNTGAAVIVGAGILASRVLGLVRESLKARYLGASASVAADAFTAAVRIPNLLQNLLGEGALSASFIPVYAGMLARGEREAARRVAGGVAALLGLVVAVAVLAGVLAAPLLVDMIAPGFEGEKRALTIHLTRILFPGTGIFVLSAWCLGVLNSHRRFLVSYAAPIAWNLAMIVALLVFGRRQGMSQLAVTLAWASVVGAAIQVLVQLPAVRAVAGTIRFRPATGDAGVRKVLAGFAPNFVSRGVVQISAYIDQIIASLLPNGVVSLLFYAQTIAVLPVSLFGMAVSAAELPELASATGSDAERGAWLRERLRAGLRNIAYFVVPSAVAFIALGDVIIAALYQHGAFTAADTRFSWAILAAYGVGLLAVTLGRLFASAYYALHDTRSPLRFAVARIVIGTLLGYVAAVYGPRLLGVDARWGAAGLPLASGLAGWLELVLLRRGLRARIGDVVVGPGYVAGLVVAAALGAAIALGARALLPEVHRITEAVVVLGAFGVTYVGATVLAGVPEARTALRRLRRR